MLRRRKWFARAALAAVPMLVAGIVVPLTQQAGAADINTAGVFELTGGVAHTGATTPPYNWATLFTSAGVPKPGVTNLINSTFIPDPKSTADFALTQNTKDTANITTWTCKVTSVTPKDELQNAYAAAFLAPTGSKVAGDRLLYLAVERGSVSGTSNAGFWLLKNRVVCDTTSKTAHFGQFVVTGSNPVKVATHTTGDIFLFASFTSGGTAVTVSFYKWNVACNGSKSQPKGCISSSSSGGLTKTTSVGKDCKTTTMNLCGRSNATAPITTPWAPGTVGTNGFFEAGIDINKVLGVNTVVKTGDCFSSFFADTRASGSSVGNEGHDFSLGGFSLCKPTTVTTTGTTKSGSVGSVEPTDTAQLHGFSGSVATETVTFKLYANSSCTGTVVFTGTAKLNATGTATITDPNELTSIGTYYWIVSYPGDTKSGGLNQASTSGCGESFTVTKASPSITTTAGTETPDPGVVGSSVTTSDTATLTSSFAATGTVTFQLFPPGQTSTTCGATAVTLTKKKGGVTTQTPTKTKVVITVTHAAASTTSVYVVSFTPTVPGTYHWVATYSGDTNNNKATETGACSAASEKVPVAKATPTLSTIMFLGDIANVTKGDSPAGTITFALYNTASCGGTKLFTTTVTLASGTANTYAALGSKLSTVELVPGHKYSWKVKYTDTSGLNNTVTSCTESVSTVS